MAAIPIPPDHGPYPDVAMGDPFDDIEIVDPFDDRGNGGGDKKKNKNNDKNDKIDNDKSSSKGSKTVYEGCTLERIKPEVAGQPLSWQRCGRRPLPFSQEQIVKMVKRHRKDKRTNSPDPDFKRLSTNQQGLVNRIIEEKRLYEKSKTAEWTLVDVQKIERRVGVAFAKEVYRLQVVIKRTDKGNEKNGYSTNGTLSYDPGDIIDLSKPLEKKKDKSKDDKTKDKKSRKERDLLDDPLNIGSGPNYGPPRDDHRNDHWDQPQQWDQGPSHPPPQAPNPPGPNDWVPHPFEAQHHHPMDPHNNFVGGARDFGNSNPFQAQPHVAAPGQYDQPLPDNRDYPHPHHGTRARTPSQPRHREDDRRRSRTRSRSERRRSFPRRPSRSRRRESRYRDDPVGNFDRMGREDRESSASSYDDRSTWSYDGRYERSTDPSVYSDDYPPRNRSKPYHRDSDPRPRTRSTRYRDVDYQPESTYRNRDRRYSRDFDRRPALPRAITYEPHDDYPIGQAAEPRYLTAPPPQRRNTDFGDKRADFFDRDFRDADLRDRGFRDWRQPKDRIIDDDYEAGVRAERRRWTHYP